MPRRKSEFPLMRYFVVSSFVTTVVVSLVTVRLSSEVVRRDLLDEARNHAIRVTQHVQKDVQHHFIRPALEAGVPIDLTNDEQYAQLDAVVRNVIDSFDIPSLYVFDIDGNIVYSTIREHVGFRAPESNDLFWEAARGRVASAIRPRGTPLDIQPTARMSLLETYVPVRSLGESEGEGRPISNVIETYQNIDALEHEVARAQRNVAMMVGAGGLAMFLVLLGIVLRADRFIHRQTLDLMDRNSQLYDLSSHLEREVKRRTDELIAREKLAGLGTLAAGLAHEVNNPLATISMCAQGLRQRVHEHREDGKPLDLEGMADYVKRIESEALRVKNITGNLLDFSRRKPSGKKEARDVGVLVDETLELIRVSKDAAGIEVECLRGDEPLVFPVDATDVQQLVFNITRNAIDAVRARAHGGDDESSGTSTGGPIGKVSWTLHRDAGALELACRDNGTGFDPGTEAKVLEPFFTTKEPGRGTGLGLSLCHTIAERNGGSLSIEAPEGGGAIVRVTLR